MNNLKDNVLTHFPLGYVTDFYRIMSTTTASTITVIDATVPSILPGGGSHIRLDANHVLDFALNATTSQFTDASSSALTFYEYTSVYWNYVLYVLLGFYLVSRVLGFSLIGKDYFNNNDNIKSNDY